MDQEWQEIKKKLHKSLSKGQYELWVSTLSFLGCEDGRLLLGCRNRFHMEWVREKLEAKLLTVARQHFPQMQKVAYQIVRDDEDGPAEEGTPAGPQQISFKDLLKKPGPSFNSRFTFDHFVVGQGNQFAYAASMAMAASQQIYNQSVFLVSQTGLGKSHLSHAVGNYLYSTNPGVRVQYATTEQFANEMIFALRHGSIEAFKNKFRNGCDVLLLERIDFLSGKEKVQSELVYTLDELMDRGKKILCTGNAHPREIPKLSTELQSRLGGLLVAPIDPPDFRTRLEIIRRKSQLENVQLPIDIAEYLADRVTGDVRQLESCLVGIIAKTNILGMPVSMDLARDVSQTMLDQLPRITVDHIQRIICSSFKISIDELRSTCRRKEIALARKIGMYLSRQYTTEPLSAIGQCFKRSHSSVLYAVKGLSKEMENSASKLKRQIDYISRRLETSCLSS